MLSSQKSVIVDYLNRSHPRRIVLPRHLLEKRLQRPVSNQRDGPHQIANEYEISLRLEIQRKNVAEVGTLVVEVLLRLPLVQTNGRVDGSEDLPVEVDQTINSAFDFLLGDYLQLPVLPGKQDQAPEFGLGFFGVDERSTDDVVRRGILAEFGRHDAQRVFVGAERVGVEHFERVLVDDEEVEHFDFLDRVSYLDYVAACAGRPVKSNNIKKTVFSFGNHSHSTRHSHKNPRVANTSMVMVHG